MSKLSTVFPCHCYRNEAHLYRISWSYKMGKSSEIVELDWVKDLPADQAVKKGAFRTIESSC